MPNEDSPFKKGTVYKFDHVCHYSEGSIASQNIVLKTTGTLNALAIDTNQFVDSKFSPFDIYMHVLEGKLETIINGVALFVNEGEFLIIPGHTRNSSQAMKPTKLLQLTIKSGYEDVV